jgi:hypothetical protein
MKNVTFERPVDRSMSLKSSRLKFTKEECRSVVIKGNKCARMQRGESLKMEEGRKNGKKWRRFIRMGRAVTDGNCTRKSRMQIWLMIKIVPPNLWGMC